MIDFVNYILFNQDLSIPHAVIAVMVDFSKAFNRINHNIIITILSEMGVPGWLLKIVIGFLSDREMILRYKGGCSTRKPLPGGGPQGAYLGGIIFIIKYNGAFLRPPIPRNLAGQVTESKHEKVKFVDDGTVAVSIDLKKCLVPDPVLRPRPLNYRERTGHILPDVNNLLQYFVKDTENFVETNNLVINKKKTKVMLFNKSRKIDFPP